MVGECQSEDMRWIPAYIFARWAGTEADMFARGGVIATKGDKVFILPTELSFSLFYCNALSGFIPDILIHFITGSGCHRQSRVMAGRLQH